MPGQPGRQAYKSRASVLPVERARKLLVKFLFVMYAIASTGLDKIKDVLPALIPLIVLELALIIIALVDLVRREHVRGSKAMWVPLIILIQIIGPVLYLTIGRKERAPERDQD